MFKILIMMKMIPCWFFDLCFLIGLSSFFYGIEQLYGLSVALMFGGFLLAVLTVFIYLLTRRNDS